VQPLNFSIPLDGQSDHKGLAFGMRMQGLGPNCPMARLGLGYPVRESILRGFGCGEGFRSAGAFQRWKATFWAMLASITETNATIRLSLSLQMVRFPRLPRSLLGSDDFILGLKADMYQSMVRGDSNGVVFPVLSCFGILQHLV
jgi:hypothetical protein